MANFDSLWSPVAAALIQGKFRGDIYPGSGGLQDVAPEAMDAWREPQPLGFGPGPALPPLPAPRAVGAPPQPPPVQAPQPPPALAPPPGALSEQPAEGGGARWGDALQGAAAWLMSPYDKGNSLSVLNTLAAQRKMDRDTAEKQAMIKQTETALTSIYGPDTAKAMARNPALLQMFTPKVVQIGSDIAGNPTHGLQIGTNFFDFQGNRIGGVGGAPGADGTVPAPTSGMQDPFLAPGIRTVNKELKGEEFLAQFAPDVRDYVRAQAEGRLPTAANARRGLTVVANMAAAKYGEDLGIPMDTANIAERQKFAKGLGDTSNPSTFGGQRTATQTAIKHLGSILDSVDELGNWNGFGSKALAELVNRPANSHLISTDREGKLKSLLDIATAYAGERMKLLSGRSGGVEERQQIAKELFGGQSSDSALRELIRKELDVLRGRVEPLEQQLSNSTLSAQTKERNRVIGDAQQKAIDDILRRTSQGYVPGAKPAATTIPGDWSVTVR